LVEAYSNQMLGSLRGVPRNAVAMFEKEGIPDRRPARRKQCADAKNAVTFAWSIVWGALLIVFGVLAIGSPFLAAVAVNAVIAWLIILAGVVHLILAFHVYRAGSMIWKLLAGLAYLFFGVYLLMHPVLGVASLTLVGCVRHRPEIGHADLPAAAAMGPALRGPRRSRLRKSLSAATHQKLDG
jgi:hypothetical protein